MYEHLVEGGYDLHVHTGPDVSPRKVDDVDYAQRIQAVGMKGFGIKSHYSSTAGRARIVKKLYPDVDAIGAIVLNHTVGGLNPVAVEMAAKEGAKIVWMPTFDAENEISYQANQAGYEELPPWATVQKDRQTEGKQQKGICILEGDELKPEVREILAIAKTEGLIIASGHLSKEEIFRLAEAAKDMNYEKLVITHPTFSSIALTTEEQQRLADLGAYLEICCGTITPHYGATWELIVEQVKTIGARHFILASDMGQMNNPSPEQGILEGVKHLVEGGISEDSVKQMTVGNPQKLLQQ